MPRNCDCSGGYCGPQPPPLLSAAQPADDGVTRRDFLRTLALGAAGTAAGVALPGGPARVSDESAPPSSSAPPVPIPTPPNAELAAWKQTLHRQSPPPPYRSSVHTDARFPLGGIGTGTFDLGADGQFTHWQLFNMLRDGQVPFFFGVRAENGVVKVLQTTGGPVLSGAPTPHVTAIEMTGEYPLANLQFRDGHLPVDLSLTAFSPFAPLDTHVASLPVAVFVFRVHNPGREKQTVSLGAFLQNPLGYDARGPARAITGLGDERHANFGGNVNAAFRQGDAGVLALHAEPGRAPTLDKPVQVFTNANPAGFNAPPKDRAATLTIEALERLPETPGKPPAGTAAAPAAQTVIWLESAPLDVAETALRAAQTLVDAGATLVFSGAASPLLKTWAEWKTRPDALAAAPRADIVFEDFENGYSPHWTTEGTAFGDRPATGTQPNQAPVVGFEGQHLVNSYANSDDATGKLRSVAFSLERNYIRLLVGGGNHATTQARLLVDGVVVRTASGKNEERLRPVAWDVREWASKSAHIEIVDEQTGAWGHINVDQIVFTDAPLPRPITDLLDALLPPEFVAYDAGSASGVVPRPGSPMVADARFGATFWTRAHNKGKVAFATQPLLDPAQADVIGARQKVYVVLSALVGASYQDPNRVSPADVTGFSDRSPVPPSAPGMGTLAIATTGPNPSGTPDAGTWQTAWNTFAARGRFDALQEPRVRRAQSAPSPLGQTVNGALASQVTVGPGETAEVPFVLAWHYPNRFSAAGDNVGNQYASLWPGARGVLREALRDLPVLRARTEQFRRALYDDSTLPRVVREAAGAQISTIRHAGVVFRLASGDIYGWEGANGCCPPTCTHVWGYEQTLAYLFPDLERVMRVIDLERQQKDDGGINNRCDVPAPPRPTGERPFTDGHASVVLRAYRESLNCSDDALQKRFWPPVRKAVEYLLARDAATTPDNQPDGTLDDDQWNTYDNALHGVSSFIGTYYLAALRAGEEMARRAGDNASAARFRAVFEKGQAKLIELCWNGEYFCQHLPGYQEKRGEFGPGCLADQLVGQWWAHQLGLGYLLPRDMVQSALRAVVKHNWLSDHSHHQHDWRKLAGGRDRGLLVCTWPRGGRPANTLPYVDEVWTGVEYQVAAHLIYEGMTDDALALVQGARDRYNGVPRAPMARNPWSEIECGGHYVRALSSWSLLAALSGFRYDGPARALFFAPRYRPNNFKALFTGPEGWGSLRQTRRRSGGAQVSEINVTEGRLVLAHLHLNAVQPVEQARVTHGRTRVPATLAKPGANDTINGSVGDVLISLAAPVTLRAGEKLTVRLG